LNEVEDEKILEAQDWLLSVKGSLFGFNTPQQGPWLVSGTVYLDQAWSGDIMYAVRPNSTEFLPVDYFVPKEGSARWIDNLVVHRESEKLWLAHEFMNYICEPAVQARISSWNLYGTPNAWAFLLLDNEPYIFTGQYRDGTPYEWRATRDPRIYPDIALGYEGPPTLERCEYQKDVGVKNTLKYFSHWSEVKF
jgi:spermidine/putrescine-binding protein